MGDAVLNPLEQKPVPTDRPALQYEYYSYGSGREGAQTRYHPILPVRRGVRG